MNQKIDFIIAWVDGWDKEWQFQRNKYAGKNPEDMAENRFRDWNNLKYIFRWIEKFTPRINNVFFVTCGHYPSWLNLEYPKLKFVKHEDYIPKEYLPTFNSHTIELNFHRIKELSEQFVYFNDDMFITNYMKESDFFENWLPKQTAWLCTIPTDNENFSHIILNNINLINRHFSHKEAINNNKKKWYHPQYWIKTIVQTLFLGKYSYLTWLYNSHLPNSLLKSTMNKLWNEEYDVLNNSSLCKFRAETNVNQYVFSRYDLMNGDFVPRENVIWNYYTIKKDNKDLINSIVKQKYRMLCINDTSTDINFEKAKSEIINAFEKILSEKSKFEI